MDKPIPEAVSVTLHQDRAGCEWIIVTSKDHPGSESEVTPSDDPALFDLLKALAAAQQQGQAVACPHCKGNPGLDCNSFGRTAPPSAPVGAEDAGSRAVAAELLRCFESWEPGVRVLGNVQARDGADLMRRILAQQPAADRETEFATIAAGADCPACGETGPCGCKGYGQQLAAVDEAMVERACKRYAFREDGAVWPDAYSEYEVLAERRLMREFLEHVLAAQHQEPTT